jgi:signal transduction histidine kinase/ActR/RegA family two-component response regulator
VLVRTRPTQASASGDRALQISWLATIVLAASLTLTGITWYLTRVHAESAAHAQFESGATDIARLTHQRMLVQESLLRGGVAFFNASNTVSREDWRRYVTQLDLSQRFPGMHALGFAIRLRPAELAEHIEAMRHQGLTNYRVWPTGRRDEHAADAFIEPLVGPNARVLGFDMLSDPALRSAIERARDSGEESVAPESGRFRKSAPDPHLYFLMYAPVYGTRAAPVTVAKRRAALRGYVFGAFDGQEIVRSVLHDRPTGTSCDIYDGEQTSSGALRDTELPAASRPARTESATLTTTRSGEIAGYPWTLRCRRASAEQGANANPSLMVLAAGIPVSLLLFTIAYSRLTLRKRAQKLANEITATLRQNVEEAQRVEANLRQAQKLQAISSLAEGIARDFNSPLGEILGYGRLAQNTADADGPLRLYIDNIMRAAVRAQSFVEHMFTFSGNGPGERIPVDAQAVVAEALDRISRSLEPGVRLGRELHADGMAVIGDPAQINQLVINLCANALEAMPSGGVVTVYLDLITLDESRAFATATLPAGDYVRLRVRDSGPGIAPDVIGRTFDPFVTTKKAAPGAGLGLSLVQGIVSNLGGAADVQSELGHGSTLSVLLPRQGRIRQIPTESKEPPRGAGETILLVDNEEQVVRVGEQMIAELGYQSVGFTSSTAALAALRADPGRFAALLSDEVMPDLTGSQLAQEVHKLRADVPIVLMSCYGEAALAARAMAAGAKDVLSKPLLARDVARCLGRVLDKSPHSEAM